MQAAISDHLVHCGPTQPHWFQTLPPDTALAKISQYIHFATNGGGGGILPV